jgi:hypothetical protein
MLDESRRAETERNEAQWRNLLDWISTANHGQRHRAIVSSRTESTCQWILRLSEYNRWRDETLLASNILYCQGIQGSGKTHVT